MRRGSGTIFRAAGVAVGDREDVDVIQQVLFADDAVDTGNQRARQRVAVDMAGDGLRQAGVYSRGSRKRVPP